MSRKIIGVTVGTPLSPHTIKEKLMPVLSVNGKKPNETGEVEVRFNFEDLTDQDIQEIAKAVEEHIEIPEGGSADWNASEGEPGYVQNRTHYKYLPFEPIEITYDPETAESVNFDGLPLYHISDVTIPPDSFDSKDSELWIAATCLRPRILEDACIEDVVATWDLSFGGSMFLLACVYQTFDVGGISVNTPGLYLYIGENKITGEMKASYRYVPIDTRFLPDDVVRFSDIEPYDIEILSDVLVDVDGGKVTGYTDFVDSGVMDQIHSKTFRMLLRLSYGGSVTVSGIFEEVYELNGYCISRVIDINSRKIAVFVVLGWDGQLTVWAESIKEIDVIAEVGQSVVVKEVDTNGRPTKWEAVKLVTADEVTAIIDEYISSALEGGY